MNWIKTIQSILLGIIGFIAICIFVVFFFIFVFLLAFGRIPFAVPSDGPPEHGKGGDDQIKMIYLEDVSTCFNPYMFDECGGVIPVLYLYVIVLVSVPILLLIFKPIESILILLIALGIGFYLHDRKKAYE